MVYKGGFVLNGGSKVGGVKCGVKWGVPCRVGGSDHEGWSSERTLGLLTQDRSLPGQ